MSDHPKFELINSPDPLPSEGSNFWKVCPRKLAYLPEKPCEMGKLTKDTAGRYVIPPCQWWIRSEDHNNCFWRFIQDKSTADGIMDDMSLAEIARLFGWSSSKINEYYKEAMDELERALLTHRADEFLDPDQG